jgi:hypothetical protein
MLRRGPGRNCGLRARCRQVHVGRRGRDLEVMKRQPAAAGQDESDGV